MKVSINITDNQFSAATKEEMWTIYKKYYSYSKADFMKRLDLNNQFAIYKSGGNIVGFTGLKIDRTKIDGKACLLIYFGQTVIEKEFRGNALLPLTSLKLCVKYSRHLLFSNIYFWYDALTYKSYLISAKTLQESYPSRKYQTPKAIKSLIKYIGQQHYKDSFCAALGTVQKSSLLVNDPSTNIGINDRNDADIQFFMKANPHHEKGHGLITLAPLNGKNFFMLVKRFATNISTQISDYGANLTLDLQLYLSKFKRILTPSS